MPLEILMFALWVAALFLVVWQAALTVQLGRLRRSQERVATPGVDPVGVGMLYGGLIRELRDTADERIAVLETRIAELEDLLADYDRLVGQQPPRGAAVRRERLRRCG